MLGGKVDRVSVESISRYFLQNFRERLALDRSKPISNAEKDKMRMETMQDIGNELAACASDKPFRYPRALPYVLRAFNALEGTGSARPNPQLVAPQLRGDGHVHVACACGMCMSTHSWSPHSCCEATAPPSDLM